MRTLPSVYYGYGKNSYKSKETRKKPSSQGIR